MKRQIGTASVFIWVGFVAAISFMEAWLKFRAPGITIPLGLGIGRLVFGALNKVEWTLLIVILCTLPLLKNIKLTWFILVPIIILLLQTFWMLPVLDARAEQHIQGTVSGKSMLHFYYIICEAVKIIFLILFGCNSFQFIHQHKHHAN